MNLNDMLIKDKNYILQNMKGGYNPFNNYYNINKIKIFGENIYTFNETNRALLSNVLDKQRPDFILLNECNKGKASFNMSNYNLILSRKQEVGIIYKNIYFLNDVFNDIEDDYNIIRLVNSKINKFIIFVTYIPPNEEHDNRLSLLIEKLMLLKRRYNNLKLVLFGDLNINLEDIDDKLKDKIEPFGFKIWYKKREYTRIQKVKDIEKKSYLDYFITYGLENVNFNIIDKLVLTDHRALSLEFFEDKNIKLERMKELIEPYAIAQIKMDEISEKLKDAFLNDITEIKIKKLIHDNTYNYKTKIRKFKFNTNKIEKIAEKIKELQKLNDNDTIKKIIHRHLSENWNTFLEKLKELRIKNNVKEYFLKLRFYTFINKNTDILKNMKINDIVTLDKQKMNIEIVKKYKNLLGDNGYKEYYFNINDGVIEINKEDIKYALNKVVKNKATSWDLIPGKAIKNAINLIDKNKLDNIYENLVKMYNRYLIPGVIPDEINTSRLFCLNKKADEIGNVDNLRPIAISSTFMKILESAIFTRLLDEINNKKILCNKQIGFIKGCGTELNLLRLKQRINDVKKEKHQFNKYLVFIDLKNAYDKVIHTKLFEKLKNYGIDNKLINTIKLIYSYAKLKVSSKSEIINVNNGVLQGSLISPLLFDLYINDLIIELSKNSYEVLAYADDLAIIVEGRNSLSNIFNILEKWSELNGIKVNKNKSGIMVIKGKEEDVEIEGYPVITEYKYLGITIDNKLKIAKHIGNIDKKLNEYFSRNFILNKRYFSVKSIMQIFGYFHRSRLLYGLPAFVDQKSWINRVDKIMTKNIKKLLKLPIRTNNERMKLALGIPDLCTYLISRLLKLKIKYENIFHEELNIYDKVIEKTIGNIKGNILYNSLKNIGNNFEYYIHEDFRRRLNKRIYSWYVDGDFLLLRFMCHRGAFREDINEKCLLCKTEDNGIEHVINNCKKLEKERNELVTELNKLDAETKNKTLLKTIEYYYYSKKLSNSKDGKKKDNKGIKLIKTFIKNMYYLYGKIKGKKDE